MRLATLVEQLAVVRTHQGTYAHAVQALLEEVPEAPPLVTLPGIDKRLISELVAAVGPKRPEEPKQFAAASDLAKLSGVPRLPGPVANGAPCCGVGLVTNGCAARSMLGPWPV